MSSLKRHSNILDLYKAKLPASDITEPSKKSGGSVAATSEKKASSVPSSTASLEGTLPVGGLNLDPSNLSLPDIDIKGLGADELLALSLKQMAQLAQREGRVTGTAAVSTFFSERGIQPEDLPGGSIAQMLAVVDNAMVDPVAERGQSIADMINAVRSSRDQMRNIASSQISFLVNAGAWNELDNMERQDLWESAGYSGVAPLIKEKASSSLTNEYIALGNMTEEEREAFYKAKEEKAMDYIRLIEDEDIAFTIASVPTTVKIHGISVEMKDFVVSVMNRLDEYAAEYQSKRPTETEQVAFLRSQGYNINQVKQHFIDWYNEEVRKEKEKKIKNIKDVYKEYPELEEAIDDIYRQEFLDGLYSSYERPLAEQLRTLFKQGRGVSVVDLTK